MMVTVDANDVVAITGTKMFKMAVLVGMVEMKALVVRLVVAVPVIVIDVLRTIHFAVRTMLGLRPRMHLALLRCGGNMSLICPRSVGAVLFVTVLPLLAGTLAGPSLTRSLGKCGQSYQCHGKAANVSPFLLLKGSDTSCLSALRLGEFESTS